MSDAEQSREQIRENVRQMAREWKAAIGEGISTCHGENRNPWKGGMSRKSIDEKMFKFQADRVEKEILKMAESISKLSVASRRMRTALWAALQATVRFNQDSSNSVTDFTMIVGK